MSTSTTVSREQLYEQIWTEPLHKLAKKYGISADSLRHKCDAAKIPRPPNGYWTQIAFGKTVKRPPLPTVEGIAESISLNPSPAHLLAEKALPPVHVPEDLRGCHSSVTATQRGLRTGSTTDQIVYTREPGSLCVFVSKASIPRALRIMEALIRAWEERGWKLVTSKTDRRGEVQINGGSVSFSLSEHISRELIPPKPDDTYRSRQYTFHPTGRLSFQVYSYWNLGTRITWSDGKVQRLENLLPQLVEGLVTVAERIREQRLAQEEQERQRAEEEKKRHALNQRRAVEKERRERLHAEATGWEITGTINRVCDELQKRATENPGRYPADAVERWITWARTVAAKHDPFENGYIAKALNLTDLDASLDCSKENAWW